MQARLLRLRGERTLRVLSGEPAAAASGTTVLLIHGAGGRADWDAWCELFTDDGVYRLVPRENHERGLPLATLSFESKGMLRDRAHAIRETLFHDPYYQRPIVGAPRVLRVEGFGPTAKRTTPSFAPSCRS